MAQFNNPHDSHTHSLTILSQIRKFDDFMESLTSIADMGCGSGMDINWWASQENLLFQPPKPFNYRCYAIDTNIKQIENVPKNVHIVEGDFEARTLLPKPVDLIWCHNTFQYCINPMNTLKLFNQQLVENGVLYLCIPTHRITKNNKLVETSANHEYFNYTLINLIYMLAVNGFDCAGGNFLKEPGDPWVHAMVYKSSTPPQDPRTTNWSKLSELGLLFPSMKESITKYGHVRREDLIFPWLDKNWHNDKD